MNQFSNKKVIVAMSGGVDSSVAAAILKNQGYEVAGIFMRLGIAGDNESEKSARDVAEKLGIKFSVLNLRKEFKKKIISYFISEYQRGRTPNPCVKCNKEIKFGLLTDKVLSIGADFMATGHYVKSSKFKVQSSKFIYKLIKAKDKNKDQSYFLYTLTQKKLKHCLFPIGDYTKTEAREMAEKYKLEIHGKKESQEICFIQTKYYGDFLRKYLKLIPGEIVSCNSIKAPQSEARLRQGGISQSPDKRLRRGGDSENILGEHKGLPLYTIGQRRDIGIGGTGPYYVVGMDYKKNQLIVSDKINDKKLFSKELIAKKINWISGSIPKLPLKVKAKVRYRMDEKSAVVDKIKEKYAIKFLKPQRAVMPGQSVVFYKGNELLGGGIIEKR